MKKIKDIQIELDVKYIKYLMEMNKDMTLSKLAEEIGVPLPTLSCAMTTRRVPLMKILYKMAVYFGVMVEDLVKEI